MRALHSTALICVLLLSGCANMRTSKSHYAGMDSMLAKADYPAAISQIENAKETSYSAKDRVVYYLDIGMLYHWNKEYEKSNEFLEQAERAIDDNFTKSLTRKASTLILNDNAQAYGGEDYEDIYVNAFKALNYLALGRNDEAFVEVRRINNKLLQLEDKHAKMARKLSEAEEAHEEFKPGKSHFQESALGRYLSMLLYRNELKWDDVRIDLEKIDKGWKLQPDIYTFDKPDFSRSTDRVFTPKARLNVIAFSGLAPDKKASTFSVYTEENVIILAGTSENYLGKQNLSGLSILPWPGVEPGYNFKFQLPHMHKRPSKVGRMEVEISNGPTENLQQLDSLANVALETFSIKKPLIYLKTVTRAVVKGLAAQQATDHMTKSMDGGMAFLTRLATTVVVSQTENADLRMSRFFPAESAIREIHLDEGIYDIKVNYYSANGALLHSDNRPGVHVEAGKLNLVESSYLN
ncbi:hypothetical protein PDESU_00739 [Pontiella desulfatans]|uniref:Lipoprotein n=2 Tax=Pontiella desulfatans TaxID=2750659 RepID=A0A6C2TWY6_PONDE|nr:hypothetical protein PDESU_00739 [Pontiella desulfatans]